MNQSYYFLWMSQIGTYQGCIVDLSLILPSYKNCYHFVEWVSNIFMLCIISNYKEHWKFQIISTSKLNYFYVSNVWITHTFLMFHYLYYYYTTYDNQELGEMSSNNHLHKDTWREIQHIIAIRKKQFEIMEVLIYYMITFYVILFLCNK